MGGRGTRLGAHTETLAPGKETRCSPTVEEAVADGAEHVRGELRDLRPLRQEPTSYRPPNTAAAKIERSRPDFFANRKGP